jgi:hypothetical protein
VQLITKQLLDDYLQVDSISLSMDRLSQNTDEGLTCQRWLRDSPPKRLLFKLLYGDLLKRNVLRQRVLDIGGGVTCFTRELAKRHEYDLVDLLAHDDPAICVKMKSETGRNFVHPIDWLSFEGDGYDLVVANDIFPNVDQRLNMFLERFLPRCRSLRLSLTWYEKPRAYKVRRVDGEEIFFMLAWDLWQLMNVLQRHEDRIVGFDRECFRVDQESLYPNGRQVGVVELRGDI